jgi:hypothetical protein
MYIKTVPIVYLSFVIKDKQDDNNSSEERGIRKIIKLREN